MPHRSSPPRARSLDASSLRALALNYVGRYATTRAKLTTYLQRKVRERGWEEDGDAPVAAIVDYCVRAGYIDEAAFAEGRATGLARRGYGAARVSQALRGAGIARDTIALLTSSQADAHATAAHFAQRRRIGRFGDGVADAAERRRQFAAMIRAGHSFDLARQFVESSPDDASPDGARPDDGSISHNHRLRNDT